MPAKKQSVYLTAAALEIIRATGCRNATGEIDVSVSGRINTICLRYDRVVREHAPLLSLAEWCVICDANNGTLDSYIWANVADSRGLADKWEVDVGSLIERMRKFTYAETVAVAEIIERFWSDCEQPDNAGWLKKCGARIKGGAK